MATIRFCNEYLRPCATLEARSYFAAVELLARWNATAAGERLTVLGDTLRRQANRLRDTYFSARTLRAQWIAEGEATFIANDATVIADGAPSDGRPEIAGTDVNIMAANRSLEFVQWLDTGQFDGLGAGAGFHLSKVMEPGNRIAGDDLTLSEITEVINRGNELITEMEADTNAVLNTVLAVAVIDPTELGWL